MKQISIQIEDDKVPFVIDLLEKFDFVKIEGFLEKEKYTITERQRELVEIERKKINENPDYLLDWDEVIERISVD
ncbi:MAG: hypothetical protein ACKVOM_05615 [Ferruginibacter sp.]